MMYFKEIQKSYYSGIPQFCVGNKEECSVFTDDGSIRVSWGQTIKPDFFKQIEGLALLPTEMQVKSISKYSSLLVELPYLKKLISPVELFENLDEASFSWTVLDISQILPPVKGKRHSLSGLYFKDLSSLTINIEMQNNNVPKLKYVETPVAERGFASISNLSSHNEIGHLILRHCKSQELIPLEGKHLKTLGITDFYKDLNALKKISSLEVLYFNTIRSEIDCNIFLELPMLKEISILNSKKIINIENLLECKNLESIYLFRCNNPLKSLKEAFREKKYKYLNIDNC